VVLAGGKLSEYSNWKQRLDLHNDPIDLRLASVREARGQERRFCFEVITPHYTRVYQATSEEDMQSWIVAIGNALKSTLEGGGSVTSFDTSSISHSSLKKDIGAVLTGKTPLSSYYHSHSQHSSSNPLSNHTGERERRTTVGSRPPSSDIQAIQNASKLLNQLRTVSESNSRCADCNTSKEVDWVSINLGIILCIECSGIHRSLGTHISKVRSLTLDSTSFTVDVIALLLMVGNKLANDVWEATLAEAGEDKLKEDATREQRLKYITNKYVTRAYISPLASADDTLLTSIKTKNVREVIHAIAAKADMNVRDRSRGTHILHLALAATDPATPAGQSTHAMPPPPREIAFPLPELLQQNGSEIPSTPASIQLSSAAEAWLKAKKEKRDGTGATMSMAKNNLVEKRDGKEGQVNKRNSTAGRFGR
jgi:Arf-GAP/SH3 domain/ANK repeat/PH domain-containing protein